MVVSKESFPRNELVTQLFIDNDMTDIVSDVRGEGDISIKHGRGSETSKPTASEMVFTINDQVKASPAKVVGKYVNRNPRSPLYGKLGRNTQIRQALRMGFTTANGALTDEADTFTRSVSNSWGTTTGGNGSAWGTASIGSAATSDYNVNGTQGTHFVDSAGEARISHFVNLRAVDVDMAVTFTCPQATGGNLEPGNFMWRWLPSSQGGTGGFGLTRVEINTSNQVILRIFGVTATGSGAELANVTTGITHTGTGQALRVRTRVFGRHVWAKIWIASGSEPAAWSLYAYDNTSTTFQAGIVGIRSGRGSGNTNATNPQFTYDNFTLTVDVPLFYGEVPSWQPTQDLTGKYVANEISAAGILRRLTAPSAKPLDSAVKRYITRKRTTSAYAYVPMEEKSSATSISYAINQLAGPFFFTSNGLTLASDSTSFPGSNALPVLGTEFVHTGSLIAPNTGTIAQGFLMKFAAAGHTDNSEIFQVMVGNNSTIARWSLRYHTGGSISLRGLDSTGADVVTTGTTAFGVNGFACKIALNLVQAGSDVNYSLYVGKPTGTTVASGTFAGRVTGNVLRAGWNGSGGLQGATLGHYIMSNTDTNVSQMETSPYGYPGETTTARWTRLCQEEGVSSQIIGTSTKQMGPQVPATLIDLLSDVEDVEQGIIFEPREFLGLGLYTMDSLVNQSATATLDLVADKPLFSPLAPLEDEGVSLNKSTVSRDGGGTSTVEQTTGSMGTQDPPTGIGVYEESVTYRVNLDSQLPDIAGWRVYKGTLDEYRYPRVVFEYVRGAVTTANWLLALTATEGKRLVLTNPPAWLPPEQLELHVLGWQITLMNSDNARGMRATYNCGSFTPYLVATVDPQGAEDYRVDVNMPEVMAMRSTLPVSINSTVTSLDIASTSFTWTTSGIDFPCLVMLEGELIRLDYPGTILNTNYSFATGTTAGWANQGSTIAIDTATLFYAWARSPYTLHITPDGVTASGGANADRVAATAGASYVAQYWIYSPGGYAQHTVSVDWYTALSGGSLVSTTIGPVTAIDAGVWTLLTMTVTAPATTNAASVRARHAGTPSASNDYYVYNVTIVAAATIDTVSPQTYTVTRSMNGIVKSHSSGDSPEFRPYRPAVVSY